MEVTCMIALSPRPVEMKPRMNADERGYFATL
jgi:hypothetical protein